MWLIKKQKYTYLCIIICFLTIGKINAQNFSYNLQSNNLNLDYTNLANFTEIRTITNAFTLNIQNSNRGRYNVYAKVVPVGIVNTNNLPVGMFSIKANNANFTLANSFYQPKLIDYNDVLLGNVFNRARRADTIALDLLLNPIGFTTSPNVISYNIVITVSEY